MWPTSSKRFGLLADGDQRADVVEEVDEEEDEDDLEEADVQGGGDVEFEGGGGEVAQAVGLRRPLGDAGQQSDDGGGEDTDQHGGAHAPGQQGGDEQESEEGERGALVASGCRG